MGTDPYQAKSLVSNDQSPFFYALKLDLSPIPAENILELDGMEWAYFVLYNRNRLEDIQGSELYQRMQTLGEGKDILIGPDANDIVNECVNRFLHNQITDKALLESIRAVNHNVQFVAKTEIACQQVKIISERELYEPELEEAFRISMERKTQDRMIADEIQQQYKNNGKYFDEFIKEEEKQNSRKGK